MTGTRAEDAFTAICVNAFWMAVCVDGLPDFLLRRSSPARWCLETPTVVAQPEHELQAR
jgi:hypothetical protein